MKLLIVGGGAREHALAWKLHRSPRVDLLLCVPGVPSYAVNLPGSLEDLEGLASMAADNGIDLTVVGPEVQLAGGIVDLFEARGLRIFGPTKAAARIESSKAFAKELMSKYGVPGPDFKVFRDHAQARSTLSKHDGPVVVKADGLAAGKGALVCKDRGEALQALEECMVTRSFGAAGDTVVLEEYLEGPEVSVFAFSDGAHISSLVAACDYKRLLDGDAGPNTGGMGSYSPPEFWTPALAQQVRDEIMTPVVAGMATEGSPYRGVLYAGLILTSQGPKVLEFNCRFGDPETQVILPLLKTDLVDVFEACIDGWVDRLPIEWEDGACAGVVMTSGGYPGEYTIGLPISGLQDVDHDVQIFHGGTKVVDDAGRTRFLTDGGRVLTVAGLGPTLAEARNRAYENLKRIVFEGAQFRTDIAFTRSAATAGRISHG